MELTAETQRTQRGNIIIQDLTPHPLCFLLPRFDNIYYSLYHSPMRFVGLLVVVFFVTYFSLTIFFGFDNEASLFWSFFVVAIFIKNELFPAEDNNEFVSMLGAEPRRGTEAYRVQKEVELRKKLAEDKKIDTLISELYFGAIAYYPSWIEHENREYVPSLITSATKSKGKGENNGRDWEITKITLNEREYRFAFQRKSLNEDYSDNGELELFDDNKKVLALNLHRPFTESEYHSVWSPVGIDAFIDGEWIEDFRSLKRQKQKDDKELSLKRAEDPKETEEMKKNFGIE